MLLEGNLALKKMVQTLQKIYEKYSGGDWREISSEEYDAFETEYDKYMEQYPIKLVEFNLDSIETELASYG